MIGTPRRVTFVIADGAMPSNDHANIVRGGCSVVSAMITGQKSTKEATKKIANAVFPTCAELRTKYAAEVPISDGRPPPNAAVRKSLPNDQKKIATRTKTLPRIAIDAPPMRFAVFIVFPCRSSPAKNVDQ